MDNNTVYIAGKITGDPDYKAKFERARLALEETGLIALTPSLLPLSGFTYEAYIRMAAAMLDECAAVCFLSDWVESNGAMYEYGRAKARGKRIFFYDEWEELDQTDNTEQEAKGDGA